MTIQERYPHIKTDCIHYTGMKPCGFAEDCDECSDFAPIGERILIVKLGALGDALRTTPLLPAIKERWPRSQVTWLTAPHSAQLLETNPLIDRLWVTGPTSLSLLMVEEFELVICLDKEPDAVTAATIAKAGEKRGYGLTGKGRVALFNPEAALENLRLAVSDELKFRVNEKSYQQLAFETAELEYDSKYDYVFKVPDEDLEFAESFIAGNVPAEAEPVIGFNLGGADVFANKRWKTAHYLTLRQLIAEKYGSRAAVLAFGGPTDQERLAEACSAPGPRIINTGSNSMTRFAALLGRCDLLVTGDSLGMHLGLAVGGWCLVLIGSTTPREIELYGRGEMMVSEMGCAPCYKRVCPMDPDCMENFRPERVMTKLVELLERRRGRLS